MASGAETTDFRSPLRRLAEASRRFLEASDLYRVVHDAPAFTGVTTGTKKLRFSQLSSARDSLIKATEAAERALADA